MHNLVGLFLLLMDAIRLSTVPIYREKEDLNVVEHVEHAAIDTSFPTSKQLNDNIVYMNRQTVQVSIIGTLL